MSVSLHVCILVNIVAFICSNYVPRVLGEGGHLDLLWFPVTQMCIGVHQSLSICARLFTQYFLQFFANGVQILRYGDHLQDLELITFS